MKAPLKPILLSALITLTAFCSVSYFSCKRDKCKAIACAYGGVCDEGVCKCLQGYEGTNCETITRQKFLGSYQVREKGTITPDRQYAMAIEADVDVNYVQIKNIYNYFTGPTIRARVYGDTIEIPNQQVSGKVIFGKGYIYSTNGYASGSQITMSYQVVDSANNLIVDDFGVYPNIYRSKASTWTKQ